MSDDCKVNEYSSASCNRGTKGCEVEHSFLKARTPEEWVYDYFVRHTVQDETEQDGVKVVAPREQWIRAIQEDATQELRAEVEALKRDKDRLDWLERNNVRINKPDGVYPWSVSISASGECIRSAIDAAMNGGEVK